MLKNFARQLTPPIIRSGLKQIKKNIDTAKSQDEMAPVLFDGDNELFLAAAEATQVYYEYGVGLSTLWIDKHTDARIIGVDTSSEWIERTAAALTRKEHDLRYVDVGPVGNWGKPVGFDRSNWFKDYVEGPWRQGTIADLVLVDGRFRISCFLNTLLRGEPGTKIVFDDYSYRPAYHVVEEFIQPVDKSARQALFVIPERLDTESIAHARDAFLMVRE